MDGLKSFFMRCIPLAFLLALGASVVWAVDGDPPGLFELDGDATENFGIYKLNPGDNPGGDDWDLLYNSDPFDSPAGSFLTWTGIIADPGLTSAFWKGPSKDINDVDQWWHKADTGGPDKNDLTNAYAAAYLSPDEACVLVTTDPGTGEVTAITNDPECDDSPGANQTLEYIRQADDLIVYFGFDRYANDGDAFGGFWFFQNKVCDNESTNRFDDCNGGPATHVAKTLTSPGDVLLLVEYPQANEAEPVIKAYEWDPNDVDGDGNLDSDGHSLGSLDQVFSSEDSIIPAECDGTNFKIACAITNDEIDGVGNDIGPVSLAWSYTPKSGPAGTAPPDSFYEGGVNLTQLLGDTLCVSSFLAESRSSRSEDAVLKDFVLGDFNVCSASIRTEIHAEPGHDTNVDGSSIDVGTTVHDAAFLIIVGPPNVEPPTGVVKFERFNNATCSAPAANTEEININTGTMVNNELRVESSSTTPPGASSLSYMATYLGDDNYSAVSFRCETVDVNKFTSSISTEIHAGSGSDGSHSTADIQNGTITVNTTIHDLGKVTGPTGAPAPTGLVSFKFFNDGTCTNEISANGSSGDLTNGTESGAITNGRKVASADFDTTGYVPSGSTTKQLSYKASYGGDANYLPATDSACEVLTVQKLTPTVTTKIHSGGRNAAHTFDEPDIQDTDFTVGGILHDMAKVSGTGPTPTGNVVFKFFTDDQCTSEVAANSSTNALNASGLAESDNFDTTGYVPMGSSSKVLAYKASYGGDGTYIAADDSSCEDLRVVKRLPSLVTRIIVLDEAQLSGTGGVTPTGNIDFRIYSGTGCTGSLIATINDVALDGNLIATLPDSAKQTLATSGSISYLADYDGDSNYVPVTHACENITVQLPGATQGSL